MTQELPKLPELPRAPEQCFMGGHDLHRLQQFALAYGRQCYAAGMEAAAKICEALRDDHQRAINEAGDTCDHADCEYVAAWDDAAAAIRKGEA